MKHSNPSDEEIYKLAEKLFYEMEPVEGFTWEDCPYSLAREILNDAAIRLGWKPLERITKTGG